MANSLLIKSLYLGNICIYFFSTFSHQTQQIKIPFKRFPENTDPKEFFF